MRDPDQTDINPRGLRVALVFAVAAHGLRDYYEYGRWASTAQVAAQAGAWLSRRGADLAAVERRALAALGDELAHRTAASLSRQAGLYTAHEMMEALDPNYRSELAETMLHECERLLDERAAD
jgi:hypothetical protein